MLAVEEGCVAERQVGHGGQHMIVTRLPSNDTGGDGYQDVTAGIYIYKASFERTQEA